MENNSKIRSAGGLARAASMTPDERRECAVNAAKARWSLFKKQTLTVPLDKGFASIPCDLSDDDFELLIATLNLWKKHLTSKEPSE